MRDLDQFSKIQSHICKFDDIRNKDFNQMLIKNVQAIVERTENESSFDAIIIKCMFQNICFVFIKLSTFQ